MENWNRWHIGWIGNKSPHRQLRVLLFLSILLSPITTPIALLIIGLCTLFLYKKRFVFQSWPEIYFLGMIVISVISWVVHPSWFWGIPTGLLPILLFGLYYLLSQWVRNQRWTWQEIQRFYLIFWLGGLYVAFIVIVQYIDWYGLTKSWLRFLLDFYEQYSVQDKSVRSTGTAGNSNTTAALLICFSLLSIYAQSVFPKRWQKVLAYAAFAVFCIAILCTGSRGAWVGVITGLLVQVWMTGRRKWTLTIFFSLVTLVLLFPDLVPRSDKLMDTIKDRLFIWSNAADMFRENWLFGTLPLEFGEIFRAKTGTYVYHAHNTFLGTAVEFGIFGLGLFLTFIFVTIRRARRWRKVAQQKEEKRLAGMLLSQIVALLGQGMYDYPILSPQVGVVMVLGAIIIHTQYEQRFPGKQHTATEKEVVAASNEQGYNFPMVSSMFLTIRNYLKK